MYKTMTLSLLLVLLPGGGSGPWAQNTDNTDQTAPEGGSSQQVEESDEAFRRRMELEDARRRDPGFAIPTGNYQRDLEKIDKLPDESRDNIRDQLVDIIMENGEWKPSDALEDYPYQPTAAAQADAELMKQEQEAWDEQIEKYHEREAQAWGAYRGPVAGPGNPTGEEGGAGGATQGQQGSEQGAQQESGQNGQDGADGNDGEQGSAGTYQPYQGGSADSSDEESTEGVSESALDFLMRGRQAGAQQAAQQTQTGNESQQQGQEAAQEAAQEAPQDSEQESAPDTRGIIAIEDLDKLRGNTAAPPPPPEEENDEP